ncbi:MAG: phage scaffolding protein [Treponemataceae bacterium]|nr:phage scaffolding protein [Treponemataceae bacterium]
MKRDFLEGLGLEADTIEKIMKENGKDVEREKAKFADYDDIKKQLETANSTLEKFKDYDQTKADVEKYKAELEKSQKESAAKIEAMERSAKVGDFLTGKKFVNDITHNAIKSQLADMLADQKNAGKSIENLFDEITKDRTDLLKIENAPTPPVVPEMKGGGNKGDSDAAARAAMGLPPKKE